MHWAAVALWNDCTPAGTRAAIISEPTFLIRFGSLLNSSSILLRNFASVVMTKMLFCSSLERAGVWTVTDALVFVFVDKDVDIFVLFFFGEGGTDGAR